MTWLQPKQLVGPNSLDYDEEVAKEIRKIDKELVIISVSGPLREGKSYLLNRLAKYLFEENKLPPFKTGFDVTKSIYSVTQGLWIWYIDHPYEKSKGILLLDIEGLEDREERYDECLICLALLLGSVFIYNTISRTIKRSLINQLNFIKVADEIHKEYYPRDGALSDDPYPILVLSLRDASLRAENETDQEYMERRLLHFCAKKDDDDSMEVAEATGGNIENVPQPRNESLSLQRNNTQEIEECSEKATKITDYFIIRYYFMFPLPCEKTDETHEESDDKLNAAFVRKMKEFCEFIAAEAPVKQLHDTPINGNMFIDLLDTYLKHMVRFGAICPVQDNVNGVIDSYNSNAAEHSCQLFAMALQPDDHLPISMDKLKEKVKRGLKDAVKHYIANAIHDGRMDHYHHLQQQFLDLFNDCNEKYQAVSSEKCKAELDNLVIEYEGDVGKVEKEYKRITKKETMGEIEWCNFAIKKIEESRNGSPNVSVLKLSLRQQDIEKEMMKQKNELKQKRREIIECIVEKFPRKITKEYKKKEKLVLLKFKPVVEQLNLQLSKLKPGDEPSVSVIAQQKEKLVAKRENHLDQIANFMSGMGRWIRNTFKRLFGGTAADNQLAKTYCF